MSSPDIGLPRWPLCSSDIRTRASASASIVISSSTAASAFRSKILWRLRIDDSTAWRRYATSSLRRSARWP
jgi:hypothetical protein